VLGPLCPGPAVELLHLSLAALFSLCINTPIALPSLFTSALLLNLRTITFLAVSPQRTPLAPERAGNLGRFCAASNLP